MHLIRLGPQQYQSFGVTCLEAEIDVLTGKSTIRLLLPSHYHLFRRNTDHQSRYSL